MWIRAARNGSLIRALAFALAVLVCGGSVDWGHAGGDDPDCSLNFIQHDGAPGRLSNAPPNPSSSESVLTDVLKGSINIPPTVTKANGDRIQVFVARDVDFRSVYELRSIAPAR